MLISFSASVCVITSTYLIVRVSKEVPVSSSSDINREPVSQDCKMIDTFQEPSEISLIQQKLAEL